MNKKIVEKKTMPIVEEHYRLVGEADKENTLDIWFTEDGKVGFGSAGMIYGSGLSLGRMSARVSKKFALEWAKAVVAFLEKHP